MKILVLCDSYLSGFDIQVLQSLKDSNEVEVTAALINDKPKPGPLVRLKREWRKGRGGFVLIQSFTALKQKFRKSAAVKSSDFLSHTFSGIRLKSTPSLYKAEVYQWIKDQAMDCILLRGFGIIREPILSICRFGVLSYHHGDMRKYRGGPPAFWELYNNEKEIGVSIQILNEGLDSGTLVLQKFFPVLPTDTWQVLKSRIYKGSAAMVLQALIKLKTSGPMNDPVGEAGHLYTLPNLSQWLALQLKVLKRKML